MFDGQFFVFDKELNMTPGYGSADGFPNSAFQCVKDFGHFDKVVSKPVINRFDFNINANIFVTACAFAEARHTFHKNSLLRLSRREMNQ